MEITHYNRTLQQDKLIGILADDAIEDDRASSTHDVMHDKITEETEDDDPRNLIRGEVLEFATNCHNCGAPCFTNMKVTGMTFYSQS